MGRGSRGKLRVLLLLACAQAAKSWPTAVASSSRRRLSATTLKVSSGVPAWELPDEDKGGRRSLARFIASAKSFALSKKVKGDAGANTKELRSLGQLALADKGLLVASSLSLVIAALCEAGVPKFSAAALSAIVTDDAAGFLAAMKGLVLLSAGSALFTGLRGGLFSVAGARVVSRLRLRLFRNLLRQEISFFDRHATGELTSRLTGDTAKLSNVVSYHVNIIVRQSIQAAGGLAYLFWLNGKMAAAAVFGLILMAAISHLNGAYSRFISTKMTDEVANANACAEQALGLVRLVRAHAAEDAEAAKYSIKLGTIMSLEESQGWAYGISRFLSAMAVCAVTSAVLLTGQRAVSSGALSGEGLTAFFFYVTFVAGSSFDVGEQWTRIQQALGAGKSVFAMAEREPVRNYSALDVSTWNQIYPPSTLGSCANDETAKLELRDVHFEYPGRPGAPVLRGLNFAVQPGEVVGLVGGSGGGKSTVIRLLCGFYAPQQGTVSLNGRDVLRDFTPAELVQNIAWVTQEPQLFPLSVAENIAYGLNPDTYTMADVERCAKLANAHGFISALPQGYTTPVGEGGGSLSGGQRQRVAIARALMRNPQVLLLDEPTSALDTESEALVQAALRNAFAGRTVVIVAHRLSTLASADRVVVLARGVVAEEGSPSELARRPGGMYAALLNAQALAVI